MLQAPALSIWRVIYSQVGVQAPRFKEREGIGITPRARRAGEAMALTIEDPYGRVARTLPEGLMFAEIQGKQLQTWAADEAGWFAILNDPMTGSALKLLRTRHYPVCPGATSNSGVASQCG